MLAYSGIAHIGYMLMGVAAMSATGAGMVLFYLVAYLFGNMGAFLVVQAVGTAEGSDRMDAYRGLAQRSPVLALSMLVFLLSLGGIPFVAGFWAKLVHLPGRDRPAHVWAGAAGRGAHDRRALLLPRARQPDVHRPAGEDGSRRPGRAALRRDPALRGGHRRDGPVSRALGEGRARGHCRLVLTGDIQTQPSVQPLDGLPGRVNGANEPRAAATGIAPDRRGATAPSALLAGHGAFPVRRLPCTQGSCTCQQPGMRR